MTKDTDFATLFEEYCKTVGAFEYVLSALLVTAHRNGIDVSGAWEAHENGSAPEWDVVVTPLERGETNTPSTDGEADDR